MKFLCLACDQPMTVTEAQPPDADGSRAVIFRCPRCGHAAAMLTNPAETQLVHALGVRLGPDPGGAREPLAHVRGGLERARADAVGPGGGAVAWSEAAQARLQAAPPFVRPMIRRAYEDYARGRGIAVITPEVMDDARRALGMG